MKTKFKIFLSLLTALGFLIAAIISTIKIAHINLEPNQSLIDAYGSYVAFMIVLYTLFVACLVYGIYCLYIQYKIQQISKYSQNK